MDCIAVQRRLNRFPQMQRSESIPRRDNIIVLYGRPSVMSSGAGCENMRDCLDINLSLVPRPDLQRTTIFLDAIARSRYFFRILQKAFV